MTEMNNKDSTGHESQLTESDSAGMGRTLSGIPVKGGIPGG
ncbi:MAG: hypothetical protein ACOX1Z_02690 [Candidatus Ratteibacteria bacterium]